MKSIAPEPFADGRIECSERKMNAMNMPFSLDLLPPGASAEIVSVRHDDVMTQRLFDLGFAPESRVDCLFRSASGDPTAYRIRGTVIALRRDDSRRISVIPLRKEADR